MLSKLHFAIASVLLCFALVLTSCSDSALTAIAKAMPVVASANQTVLTTVTSAQAAGVMTADEARPIVQINLEVAQAGKQVDAAIAGLNSLTPAQKLTISAQIAPIATAVTNTVATLQIKDQTTKTAILAALTTIQTALAAVTVALGK